MYIYLFSYQHYLASYLLVHQNIAEPRLAIFEVNERLVRLRHGPDLHPGLDAFLCGESQHLPNIVRRANAGTGDPAACTDKAAEGEGDLVLGQTDLDESGVTGEEADVVVEGHLCR